MNAAVRRVTDAADFEAMFGSNQTLYAGKCRMMVCSDVMPCQSEFCRFGYELSDMGSPDITGINGLKF